MVWEGNDVFVLLATGFGKSIIYEVLLFVFDYKLDRVDGATRSLVSPLISQMAHQVASLRRRGARAAMISSKYATLDKSLLATEKDLCACSFLFGSPEALITSKWRDTMDCRDVAQRIIVDEAHCVSKWYVLCVIVSTVYLCVSMCMCIHTCMLVDTQFSCTHKLTCVCDDILHYCVYCVQLCVCACIFVRISIGMLCYYKYVRTSL